MAASSLVQLGIARQTAQGVIATGAYTAVPRISDGLTGSVNTVESQVSDGVSRLAGAQLPASFSYAGEISSEFREEVFDDILAGCYADEWDLSGATEDTLTVASEDIFYTIVKVFPDIAGNLQTHVYQDSRITNIALTMSQGAIIGFNFGVASGELTFPTAPPWSVLNPAPVKSSRLTCNTLTDVLIDGVPVTSIITDANLNFTNNVREIFDVRSCTPALQALDTAAISGNINMFHDDFNEPYFRGALQSQAASVEYQLTAETKTYRFEMPEVTQTTSGPDTSGDDVVLDFPWSVQNTLPIIHRSK